MNLNLHDALISYLCRFEQSFRRIASFGSAAVAPAASTFSAVVGLLRERIFDPSWSSRRSTTIAGAFLLVEDDLMLATADVEEVTMQYRSASRLWDDPPYHHGIVFAWTQKIACDVQLRTS